MSGKKNHNPAPVPPGNRRHAGPPAKPGDPVGDAGEPNADNFQEQDVQRRLGDYEGRGEHSIQQPGRLNDGDVHSK